jgi:sugar-specific transcriptional regulator TrmB
MDALDFEKLGLNKNEAKVYYELLKLGRATASQLVKHMGIHRNIIYDNLDKLIEKGLVSYVIEETKKVFIAQEPDTILEFLNNKKENIEKEIIVAKELIPQVSKLRNNRSGEQEAEIFRGINGMKKVLLKTLSSKEILVLGMTNKSTEILGETYWKNYNAKIKANKIKERFLINSDFKDIYSFSKNKNIQIKLLPKELNQMMEIIFFDGNIAIFIYSESPMVFLIKDEATYQAYVQYFEFLWKIKLSK